ncbi:gliding motility-associated C-terminal domain-containing protein [Pedobacter sp. MR2016-24]|uniref:gliding motility-associated C-terminal domain-containing protein n=1 Tax=Pedobacter sp. MR2016-24 TaxID=2994466 RepID=UPI00224590DF|nr:gliding motility-associated C-terminal domain-containing protein [Pedobacter sp. MR2016-24]MCX2486113.1 gliding motility-associated C-terminal domain-containing protein [Pedobacter sp. MR2016-24]
MMNNFKYLFGFLFLLLCTDTVAQTVSSQVFGTTGGSGAAGDKIAEWSVGGTAVTTTAVLPGGLLLTQGFLQPRGAVIQLTLLFNSLDNKVYEDLDFELYAVASDGSEVVYESSDSNIAQIINGNVVKIVGAGTANIKATIKGTTVSVNQALVVDKAGQVITFDIIPVLYKGDAAYAMSAYSDKGLPVTFANSNPYVVKLNGNAITPVDLGKATITVSQAGNANYKAAEAIQLVEVISRNGETVSIPTVITPNGDGLNDVLIIKGIENYPDNHFVIVNRNGTKIFDVANYDNSQVIFLGKAKVNGTFEGKVIGRTDYLPQGTYFYSLSYQEDGKTKRKTGYIVLKY